MANTVIQLKHSTVQGNVPVSLANGEISINTRDGKLFYADPTGTIQEFSGFPGPAGLNQEIQFNDSGTLGANSQLTFNKSLPALNVGGVSLTNTYIQFGDGTRQYTANAGTSGGGGGTNAAIDRKTYTATTAQTSFAINYSSPFVLVTINGVTIDPTEFTATNNTSITLVTGTQSGDIVDLIGFAGNVVTTAIDQSARDIATGAFEVANSASSYANSAFLVANTANNNTISAGVYANGAFATANNEAGVNLTQNNSITAAFTAANSAGVYANGAFAAANNEAGVNATQNTNITNAQNTAAAAFIRANNSLSANVGGTVSGDVSITGNLIVLGNTFSVSSSQIVANDTLLILGVGNYTSDVLDIGFSSHYNAGVNAHTGLIRDAGTKEWQLFEGYTPEIGANNNININDPSFKIAILNANLHSTSIELNGQDLQTYINRSFNTANAAFIAANTADNKGTSAGIYANGAFTQANTNATNITVIQGVNTSQNNEITYAENHANAAFIRANNSLNANVGGVVTGLLNVTSNIVTTNLTVTSNATSNLGAVKLIGSPSLTNLNTGLLQIGVPLGFNDTNILFSATHNVNSYAQFILQNQNAGSLASADYIVNNDRPGGTAIYGDFGINSSTYSGLSPFNQIDGTYLFGAGGSLTVGTNSTQDFRIATNDTLRANVQASTGKMHFLGDLEVGGNITVKGSAPGKIRTINFVIDGGGATITTGSKGNVMVDFDGTIDSWTILGDTSGNVSVDISKASYTNFPTFTASGGTSPTLTNQQKNQRVGVDYTGFTTVSANDIIRYAVSGTPANVTLVTVALKITSTS